MTDLHEIYNELYTEAEADAIAQVYEMDRLGAFPSIPLCFIDRTARVGKNTKVWWYARVLAGVVIGRDCSIGGGTEIGKDSTIGDMTRIGANVFIPSNTCIGKSVFVGPGVVMTDDKYPKVPEEGAPPYLALPPIICDHAVIGAGVILLPGVTVGEYAFIGAGAVVTRDVRGHTSVIGFPARRNDA